MDERRCSECGEVVPEKGVGRRSTVCSDQCRKERRRRLEGTVGRRRKQHEIQPCQEVDCDRPAKSKGLCIAHYGQLRRVVRQTSAPVCVIEGCNKASHAKGMCPAHYRRHRLGLPLDVPLRGETKFCTVEGCERPVSAQLLCTLHYGRKRLTGEVGPVDVKKRHGVFRWRDKSGYIYVEPGLTGRGKRMAEHRFVMEQMLGRELYPEENVHHKNGVRDDNRPENLELWVKPQAAGQRVEDLVAWVVEHYPGYVRAALEAQAS